MTDTILVPVDVSRFGEWAIPIALGVARSLDCDIELVLVFEEEPVLAQVPPLTLEEAEKRLREYVEGVRERIVSRSQVPVSSTVLRGPVAKAIEQHVAATTPRLIVMSTHGHGPLTRAWLGSVADRLVRHVDTPLLLVRPQETGRAELTDTHRFTHVMIAVDGSERAEHSLDWALKIARATQASVTLLRVVPSPLPLASPYLPHAVKERHQALEHGRDDAERYLHEVAERLRGQGVEPATDVLVDVAPASGILREVERRGADLIAIATHGRGGLPRAILGSVADKVLRAAPVPVLLTRAAE